MWESGTLLRLTSVSTTDSVILLVEKKGSKGGGLTLSLPEKPYERLYVCQNGSVKFRSDSDKGIFTFEEVIIDASLSLPTTSVYVLKSKQNGCIIRLENGDFKCMSDAEAIHGSCNFRVEVVQGTSKLQIAPAEKRLYHGRPTEVIKKWEMRRFVNEGFIQLRSLVDTGIVDQCVKYLNNLLGTPGAIIPGGNQGEFIGKFDGRVTHNACVLALFNDKVELAVRQLFSKRNRSMKRNDGQGICPSANETMSLTDCSCIDRTSLHPQVAFRFPTYGLPTHTTGAQLEAEAHQIVDYKGWHTDGLRQGKSHPFSLLVGVCLSSVSQANSGNLLVWPGSHRLLHRCKVGRHGAIDIDLLRKLTVDEGFVDAAEGEYPVGCGDTASASPSSSSSSSSSRAMDDGDFMNVHNNEPELPSLGEPLQMLAEAGDVLLLHPDTAHAGGPNASSEIRRMVYFRVKCSTKANISSGGVHGVRVHPKHAEEEDVEGRQRHLPAADDGEFLSWAQVEELHRSNMWVDLRGLEGVEGVEMR